jgi:WD40 repeat protein
LHFRQVNFTADSRSLIFTAADFSTLLDLNGNLVAEFDADQVLFEFYAGKVQSRSVIFAVAGNYLFTSGAQSVQAAQVWTFSGEHVTELKGHFSSESSAKLSPDGKHIVTTSRHGVAQVWDFSGALIAELKGNFPAAYLASFSHDGKSIVTASEDRAARIWSLTGALLNTFGHPTRIMSADFSPDGQHLMTVCDDPIVRLWSAR